MPQVKKLVDMRELITLARDLKPGDECRDDGGVTFLSWGQPDSPDAWWMWVHLKALVRIPQFIPINDEAFHWHPSERSAFAGCQILHIERTVRCRRCQGHTVIARRRHWTATCEGLNA